MKVTIIAVAISCLMVLAYLNGSIEQVDFGPERGVLPTYCADPWFTGLATVAAFLLYLVEEEDD